MRIAHLKITNEDGSSLGAVGLVDTMFMLGLIPNMQTWTSASNVFVDASGDDVSLHIIDFDGRPKTPIEGGRSGLVDTRTGAPAFEFSYQKCRITAYAERKIDVR